MMPDIKLDSADEMAAGYKIAAAQIAKRQPIKAQ